MKTSIATSQLDDSRAAIADTVQKIMDGLDRNPDFALIAYTEHHDPDLLHAALTSRWPDAVVLGSSTCRGVMTHAGLSGFGTPALAVAAFSDPDGDYGTAPIGLDDDLAAAVADAVGCAQAVAGRPGEMPDLVWVHASPGREEAILSAIRDTLGQEVLIAGGSSADETIGGKWSQFEAKGVAGGAAIALFYSDDPILHHFQNGYLASDLAGKATRAAGRTLYEIDGRPAAEVYNDWTGGAIDAALADRSVSILGDSAWFPLGKSIGQIGPSPDMMVDCYCLVHPDSVGPDGELCLFADVAEGAEVVLMKSGEEELVKRARQVVRSSLDMTPGGTVPAGALMVFCAGCMLALGDQIATAADEISAAFGDVPFLGIFTFGEQGSFRNGERLHGNLMISSTLFGRAA